MTGGRAPARLAWLDAARGAAVLGIVPLNARWILHPRAYYTDPSAGGDPSAADWIVWAATTITLDETTLWLLAAVFGASLAAAREQESDATWRTRHYARLLTLALMGTAQSLLVWPGDILLPYALTALLISGAVADRECRPGALAAGAAAIPLVLAITMTSVGSQGEHAGAEAAYAEWETGAYTGGFGAAVGARWLQLAEQLTGTYPYRVLWQTAAAMLGGMWWYRARRSTKIVPAQLAMLAVAGASLTTGGVALLTGTGYEPAMMASCRALIYAGGGALAAAALLAAARAPAETWRNGIGAALTATGRRSLSVYLGANVALAAIAQGWGMGLHGQLSGTQTAAASAAVVGAALLLAKQGGAEAGSGPAERAWRLAIRLFAGSRGRHRRAGRQADGAT